LEYALRQDETLEFLDSETSKPKSSSRTTQILLFVLQTALLCSIAIIATRFYIDIERSELLNENIALRDLVDLAESRISLLNLRVDSLHTSDTELRALTSLDPIPDDARDMGIGGAFYEEWPFRYKNLDLGLIERLGRETELLRTSMKETGTRLLRRQDELRHLPSIIPVQLGTISSGYGRRPDPFTGRRKMHKGLDFQAPSGTKVLAPADGRVILAGRMSGFGRVIKVDHGNKIITVYAHLSVIRVRVGQQVKRGAHIGDVGSSGRSTSSHLHYEVRVNGRHKDPADYLLGEW
jgi:murein DD-endopeptidase MepM/ murein hydrolase activator NlpD